MKIIFVIPSLHPGGMERVMSMLLGSFKNLVPNGELHLVLYGIKRDVFYNIPDEVIVHRPSFEFDNSKRILHTLKTIFFLRSKLTALNADSILSFGERWNSVVLLSGLFKNWPIFVSDRCQPDLSLGWFQDILRNWLYPKAKGVIAQTYQAKTIFQDMYHQQNMPVIGNPVKQISEVTNVKRDKIVLCVGRLVRNKHHAELIDVF